MGVAGSVDKEVAKETERGGAAAANRRRLKPVQLALGGLAILLLPVGAIYLFAERDTGAEVAAPPNQQQVREGNQVPAAPSLAPQASPARLASADTPQQSTASVPSAKTPTPQTPSGSPSVTAQNSNPVPADQARPAPSGPSKFQASGTSRQSMTQEPVALPNPEMMVVQASRAHIRSAPSRS